MRLASPEADQRKGADLAALGLELSDVRTTEAELEPGRLEPQPPAA